MSPGAHGAQGRARQHATRGAAPTTSFRETENIDYPWCMGHLSKKAVVTPPLYNVTTSLKQKRKEKRSDQFLIPTTGKGSW